MHGTRSPGDIDQKPKPHCYYEITNTQPERYKHLVLIKNSLFQLFIRLHSSPTLQLKRKCLHVVNTDTHTHIMQSDYIEYTDYMLEEVTVI